MNLPPRKGPLHGPKKSAARGLAKSERERKIKAIHRELEAKKRALGLKAPALRRGPVFYLVILLVLGLLGAAILQYTRDDVVGRKAHDARVMRAQKSVDALAEALGRYRFHCGVYPTAEDGGLEALTRKSSPYAGWVGPYASRIVDDPWKHPYVYETSSSNAVPVVLSLGPDGKRDTLDDVRPDPVLFTRPFRDTTWTNDWVPHWNRGIIIRKK